MHDGRPLRSRDILFSNGNGLSLEDTVSHIINHDRDLLPENKRVRDWTLSENSSGYQKARKNLSLDTIHEFSSAVCDYLGRCSEPVFGSRRVFVIDGTTITVNECPQPASFAGQRPSHLPRPGHRPGSQGDNSQRAGNGPLRSCYLDERL